MPKSMEGKVGLLYRFVEQCATLDSFRVTPGEVATVHLFRGVPGPGGVGRGIVLVGEFTIDEAIELAKGCAETL